MFTFKKKKQTPFTAVLPKKYFKCPVENLLIFPFQIDQTTFKEERTKCFML